MVENCANCAFGRRPYGSEIMCHRNAPVVFYGVTGGYTLGSGRPGELQEWKETKGPITAWPSVQEDDFCGEFELKDAG